VHDSLHYGCGGLGYSTRRRKRSRLLGHLFGWGGNKVQPGIEGLEQLGRGDLQGHRESQHVEQGDIPLTMFDLANVVPVQPRLGRQIALPEPAVFPQVANSRPKEMTGRLLAVALFPSSVSL
jgi:hypothetical protein